MSFDGDLSYLKQQLVPDKPDDVATAADIVNAATGKNIRALFSTKQRLLLERLQDLSDRTITVTSIRSMMADMIALRGKRVPYRGGIEPGVDSVSAFDVFIALLKFDG